MAVIAALAGSIVAWVVDVVLVVRVDVVSPALSVGLGTGTGISAVRDGNSLRFSVRASLAAHQFASIFSDAADGLLDAVLVQAAGTVAARLLDFFADLLRGSAFLFQSKEANAFLLLQRGADMGILAVFITALFLSTVFTDLDGLTFGRLCSNTQSRQTTRGLVKALLTLFLDARVVSHVWARCICDCKQRLKEKQRPLESNRQSADRNPYSEERNGESCLHVRASLESCLWGHESRNNNW